MTGLLKLELAQEIWHWLKTFDKNALKQEGLPDKLHFISK